MSQQPLVGPKRFLIRPSRIARRGVALKPYKIIAIHQGDVNRGIPASEVRLDFEPGATPDDLLERLCEAIEVDRETAQFGYRPYKGAKTSPPVLIKSNQELQALMTATEEQAGRARANTPELTFVHMVRYLLKSTSKC